VARDGRSYGLTSVTAKIGNPKENVYFRKSFANSQATALFFERRKELRER